MADGWLKWKGKWYYLDPYSGKMKTGKQVVSGKTYFLDGNGAMKTGWIKTSGNWYYANKSGAFVKGWQKVKGTWYCLNPADYKMLTGKQVISGKTYFLKSSGAMKTGWSRRGLEVVLLQQVWIHEDECLGLGQILGRS